MAGIGSSGFGGTGGMRAVDAGSRGGAAARAELSASRPKPPLHRVVKDVQKLLAPYSWLLAGSFLILAVNRLCGLVIPASTRYLVDDVMTQGQMGLLKYIIAAVIVATLVQGITSYTLTQVLSKAGQRLITDLRIQVQRHVGRLPVSYYDSNRTGALVSRIMSDVEGVRNLMGTGLMDFAGGILTAIYAFVYLFRQSPQMTMLIFCIIAVFALFLQKAFRTIRPIFRERGKINAEVTGRLTESLGGVRVVKGYHAEESEARVFAFGANRLLANVISSLTAQSLMSLASTAVLGVVGALVMYFGATRHHLDPKHFTVGIYITYTMFLAFMIAPVMQVVAIGTQLTEAIAGLDRTYEILSVPEEDTSPERVNDAGPINGEVDFDNVHFEYEKDKPVLHGITFTAQPGTVTALVGSSGSGKSTIISLVCGFHTANTGRVLIDGVDLATIRLSSYRQQLGVVLQETFLFDGSIRENVKFSRPESTEQQMLEACRIARVDEYAERFPEGYDTIVGERGVKLSGGQRQRLSIARAILADPRILILDEATSSLDSESEALIQHGLSFLMQGRTTFVIAHRLSTIRRADQILVIEQGNVVESGTHESLFALRGRYYDLYTRQHGLEANLFLAPGEGDSNGERKD